MSMSGRTLIGAELGRRYGITDVDGKQPIDYRNAMGAPAATNPCSRGVAQVGILTNPIDGEEDTFNKWYDEVHVPDVLDVPGVVAAQAV